MGFNFAGSSMMKKLIAIIIVVTIAMPQQAYALRPAAAIFNPHLPKPEADSNLFIIDFDDVRSRDRSLVGGKGASLPELGSIDGIDVPEGFNVTTIAYDRFIRTSAVTPQIEKLEELSEEWVKLKLLGKDDEETEKLSKRITDQANRARDILLQTGMPADIQEAVRVRYQRLCKDAGEEDMVVSIRSSADAEDLPTACFAGQHDTDFKAGEKEVVAEVLKCWVSLFSDRAVMYRNDERLKILRGQTGQYADVDSLLTKNTTLKHGRVKLAVVVQKMIDGLAAGTGFNVDRTTGAPEIYFEANYGLGKSVVDGIAIPDTWRFDVENLQMKEKELGSKLKKVVYGPRGMEVVDTTKAERENFAIPEDKAAEIAGKIKRIGEHYRKKYGYKYIDVEFVLDKQYNIYFVQARPETLWSARADSSEVFITGIPVEEARKAQIIFEGGKSVYDGAVSGVLRVIENFGEAQERVKTGDILIAYEPVPEWNIVLSRIAGGASEAGGTSCHLALVCGERGVPGIVGAANATKILKQYDGCQVTLDTTNRVIYRGVLPISKGCRSDFIRDDIARQNRVQEEQRGLFVYQGQRWWGKPEYPLGRLQLDLYERAMKLLGEWFGMQITYITRDNLLLVKSVGKEEMNKPNNIYWICEKLKNSDIAELEKLLEDRRRTVEEFSKCAEEFEVTPEKMEKFINIYIKLIAHFHLRWYFDRMVMEPLAEQQLAQLPESLRQLARTHFRPTAITEAQRKQGSFKKLVAACQPYANLFLAKTSTQVIEVLNQVNPSLMNQLYAYARKYKFDTDDIRLPIPVDKAIMEIQAGLKNLPSAKEEPSRGTAPSISPAIEQYAQDIRTFERILRLTNEQAVLKEDEHHIQVRAQWAIKDKLLEFAQILVNNGRLSKAEDILEISVSELILLVKENSQEKKEAAREIALSGVEVIQTFYDLTQALAASALRPTASATSWAAALDIDYDAIDEVIREILADKRGIAYEHEGYKIFKAAGLKVPEHEFIPSGSINTITRLLLEKFKSKRIVLKLVSREITHKSKKGGVKIIGNNIFARMRIKRFFNKMQGKAGFAGILICDFEDVEQELAVGTGLDAQFGQKIVFGQGGTAVEKIRDLGVAFVSASEDALTLDEKFTKMIGGTKVGHALDKRHLPAILDVLKRMTAVADHLYCKNNISITGVDINPVGFKKDGTLVCMDSVVCLEPVISPQQALGIKHKYGFEATADYYHSEAQIFRERDFDLGTLFNPETIGVIGSATSPITEILVNNLKQSPAFKDKPDNVISINMANHYESNVTSSLTRLDLVVVIARIDEAIPLMEDILERRRMLCNAFGVPDKPVSFVIVTAGFGEAGHKELDERLGRLLKEYPNVRAVGPNGLGFLVTGPKEGFSALLVPPTEFIMPPLSDEGDTAIIAQSGGFIGNYTMFNPDVKLAAAVGLGNCKDLGPADFLRYLIKNKPRIKNFVFYIEGFRPGEGRAFYEAVKEATARGKYVEFYYGVAASEEAKETARTHTEALTADPAIVEKALLEAGAVITRKRVDEPCDYKAIIASLEKDYPEWVRYHRKKHEKLNVGMVANAGIEAVTSLEITGRRPCLIRPAKLVMGTTLRLQQGINWPSTVTLKIPLDLTGAGKPEHYLKAVRELLQAEEINCLVISMMPLPHVERRDALSEDSLYVKIVNMTKEYNAAQRKIDPRKVKPVIFAVTAPEYFWQPIFDFLKREEMICVRYGAQGMRAFHELLLPPAKAKSAIWKIFSPATLKIFGRVSPTATTALQASALRPMAAHARECLYKTSAPKVTPSICGRHDKIKQRFKVIFEINKDGKPLPSRLENDIAQFLAERSVVEAIEKVLAARGANPLRITKVKIIRKKEKLKATTSVDFKKGLLTLNLPKTKRGFELDLYDCFISFINQKPFSSEFRQTNFAELVPQEELDRAIRTANWEDFSPDSYSGMRSVTLRLRKPIVYNGVTYTHIKLKGVVFNRVFQPRAHKFIAPATSIDSPPHEIAVPDISNEGFFVQHDQLNPEGGLMEDVAENEITMMQRGLNDHLTLDIPLGHGVYDRLIMEGQKMAYVASLVPGDGEKQMEDLMSECLQRNAPVIGNTRTVTGNNVTTIREEMEDIFYSQGQKLREAHDKGMFLAFPHIGNFYFLNNKYFHRDFSEARVVQITDKTSYRRALGCRLIDIAEALQHFHQLQIYYDHGREYWDTRVQFHPESAFLMGYFYDRLYEFDSNFFVTHSGDICKLLIDSDSVPVNEQKHKIIKMLANICDGDKPAQVDNMPQDVLIYPYVEQQTMVGKAIFDFARETKRLPNEGTLLKMGIWRINFLQTDCPASQGIVVRYDIDKHSAYIIFPFAMPEEECKRSIPASVNRLVDFLQAKEANINRQAAFAQSALRPMASAA